MALKTQVKVGNISNLSDCRYCAGMGVDYLGFRVVNNQSNYISPQQFQEFRGWFTGPKVVAELYGLQTSDLLEEIISNYAPDLFEFSLEEVQILGTLPKNTLLRITYKEFIDYQEFIKSNKDKILHLILPKHIDNENLISITRSYSAFVEIEDVNNLEDYLKQQVAGVVLHGTPEEKPGLKNYDDLAEILEKLELED